MIQTAQRSHASPARLGLALLAIVALAFSLLTATRPVLANHVEGNTVWLNQDLGDGVASDSPGDFAGSGEDCAGVEEGTVLFHFVANQLAEGTTSGTLTATFSDHEDVTVNGYFPSGHVGPTMHFDVVLTESVTLTGASATFDVAQTEDTNLLLSHVCDKTEGQTESDLSITKVDDQGAALADVSLQLTGEGYDETLTTDGSGNLSFMGLTEGTYALTETSNPDDTCDISGTLTVEVAADGTITITDDDPASGIAVTDNGDGTFTVTNTCEEQGGGTGMLEVEKFFCPTDGETRTEFDVFGPAEPQMSIQNENGTDTEGCSIGSDVTFTIWQGETQIGDALVTDENGIIEIQLAPGDYTIREEASGATADFSVAEGQVTAIVVVNYVAQEQQPGTLEVEKFFCPTDGETRTEFDVFGPAEPQMSIQNENGTDTEGCDIGSDVSFTLWSVGDDAVVVDDNLTTDENGIIEIQLAPGDYRLCENMSGECADFTIAEGQVTAIVVVNYVAAPQGQIKILKYFCDSTEDSVEFFQEGEAPNLENCDPGDAEFTLDGGEAFSTNGGIAVVWADEGQHTLAEVGTDASTTVNVTEGEISTVIVLNNQAPEQEQGSLEIFKYFCESDADSTVFYGEGDNPNLEGCDLGDAIFTVDGGEAFSTVDGTVVVNLDAGSHTLAEVSSGVSADVDIASGETTTVTVVNNVATEVEQGQVKVLKYFCESDAAGVEFFMEGQAPSLENCDPGDAEFMLDDGDPWSTTDGIAVVSADVGTHTLTEVSSGATSDEFAVVANETTTLIVLNMVESQAEGGTGGNTGGNTGSNTGGNAGGESGVLAGQGGPGGSSLPNTAVPGNDPLPVGLLAVLMLGAVGGMGLRNLQAVRRRTR